MSRSHATFRRAALAVLVAALLAGCGDDAPAPLAPPALELELALDAMPGAVQKLPAPAAKAPTFREGELSAWSLEALFGGHARDAGARLEVYDAQGTRTLIERPFRAPGGMVWVARRNKKGEAQLALVDPADPFPDFHGRGGSRGRSGEATQHIRDVVRLRLVFYKVEEPAATTVGEKRKALEQLTLTVDGAARTIEASALEGLEPLDVPGDRGEGLRDAWPLRDLVRALGGETARLARVEGRGGTLLDVTPEAWADASHQPMLRANRRGQLKFVWVGPDLRPRGEPDLRDVTGLALVTR